MATTAPILTATAVASHARRARHVRGDVYGQIGEFYTLIHHFPSQVGLPVLRRPTTALDRVRACVGDLDPVRHDVRQRRLDDLPRMVRVLDLSDVPEWSRSVI